MSLPAPNLDDRSFDDIMQESLARIAERCPSWTDFNPSDPGMTIVELFAWMTESIIYRLNRVPEKNYVTFLQLLGLSLMPPQAARTWITVTVARGAEESQIPSIPARSRVSTGRRADVPVLFETVDELNLTAARFTRAVARYREELLDLSDVVGETRSSSPHALPEVTPHLLLLSTPRLLEATEENRFRIHVVPSDDPQPGVAVEWECWNGTQWEIVVPIDDGSQGFAKEGDVEFEALPITRSYSVDGITGHWIRARLLGASARSVPSLTSIRHSLILKPGYSLRPTAGCVADNTPQFFPVDFTLAFRPFAGWPHPDDEHYVAPDTGNAFYIGSPVFGRPGNRVTLSIRMSPRYSPASDEALSSLLVQWEYYSAAGRWTVFGTSKHTGMATSRFDYTDSTDAFTESGAVTFTVQDDAAVTAVSREETYWIRCRIMEGSFGDEQVNAPLLDSIRLSFEDQPREFNAVVTSNYFESREVTAALARGQSVAPFVLSPEREPMLYLCLDSKPAPELRTLYVELAAEEIEPQQVVWEYRGPSAEWQLLTVSSDTTEGFSRTGIVTFLPPADWTEASVYGETGYWLRLRWVAAAGRYAPPIVRVRMNGVAVEGALSVYGEVLGSSSGEANQRFKCANRPILPDPVVSVCERENPSDEEIQRYEEEDRDAVFVERDDGRARALWVRWHAVPSFVDAGPESRCFVLDQIEGELTFGDGTRGRIPPLGSRNIRCDEYRVCLGEAGNVGRKTITVLDSPIQFVDAVENPLPATGGSDAESVSDAKRRGPWAIRHRYRAVTAADFERLAYEAAGAVAKATCSVTDGVITVTIIPKGGDAKPKPGAMLVRRVREYLDERRLVTTRLRVRGPHYEEVTIEAEIVAAPHVSDIPALRARTADSLRRFVHPLTGGPSGTGWPIGRPVHLSEIYYLLEQIDGVDYVHEVKLNGSAWTDRVDPAADSYPYFSSIVIGTTSG